MNQSKPEILADAGFTRDMVETLNSYFESYAKDGVVTVQVTTHGLWLYHPYSRTRQFLGRADYPDKPVAYQPSIGHLQND